MPIILLATSSSLYVRAHECNASCMSEPKLRLLSALVPRSLVHEMNEMRHIVIPTVHSRHRRESQLNDEIYKVCAFACGLGSDEPGRAPCDTLFELPIGFLSRVLDLEGYR
jgi:hypothetical protein